MSFQTNDQKGISFEKLDELYSLKVPPRHFKKVSREAGTGHIRDSPQQVESEVNASKTDKDHVERV